MKPDLDPWQKSDGPVKKLVVLLVRWLFLFCFLIHPELALCSLWDVNPRPVCVHVCVHWQNMFLQAVRNWFENLIPICIDQGTWGNLGKAWCSFLFCFCYFFIYIWCLFLRDGNGFVMEYDFDASFFLFFSFLFPLSFLLLICQKGWFSACGQRLDFGLGWTVILNMHSALHMKICLELLI